MAEETQPQGTEGVAPEAAAAAAPQTTEIDGLSKFTFQGREYDPEKLNQIVTGYEKLSEQQKSYAETQRFYENLDADLDNVLKDPSLAQKFKEIYPKQFHGVLDKFLKTNGPEKNPTPPAQNALPPEVLKDLEDMKMWRKGQEQREFQTQVDLANAQIDKITQPLYQKYQLADESAVLAKAEALINSGMKLNEKTWERLIKENHEAVQKRWDQFQGAQLKQQVDKGKKAQDTGPGGSTPGQAPPKRTMRDAEEAWLKDVMSRGQMG